MCMCFLCVCVFVCLCACVCTCACVFVCACVHLVWRRVRIFGGELGQSVGSGGAGLGVTVFWADSLSWRDGNVCQNVGSSWLVLVGSVGRLLSQGS